MSDRYHIVESKFSNYAVINSETKKIVAIEQDRSSAENILNTLVSEYQLGYDAAIKTQVAMEGYHPSDAVDLGDPPGDE